MICKMFAARVACIAVLIVLSAGDLLACTCPDFPDITLATRVNTALKQADAVFSGAVLNISENRERHPYLLVEMSAINVWKGDLSRTLVISTAQDGAACGVSFEKGEKYLVYAWNSPPDFGGKGLSTWLCSRTSRISKAKEDIQVLGEPKKVFEPLTKP